MKSVRKTKQFESSLITHKILLANKFSEKSLVVFAMAFSFIGSYSALRALAEPSDGGSVVLAPTSSEQAVSSGILGASAVILATGPIAVLFFWWLWRRSSFIFVTKFLISITSILAIFSLNQ